MYMYIYIFLFKGYIALSGRKSRVVCKIFSRSCCEAGCLKPVCMYVYIYIYICE